MLLPWLLPPEMTPQTTIWATKDYVWATEFQFLMALVAT